MSLWAAPVASRVSASLSIPGSKSLTNRYLILGAIGASDLRINNPLVARDTVLMASALESLGAHIDKSDGVWTVTPARSADGSLAIASGSVDVGLAGTVMRFVPPLAALSRGDVSFDGDLAARTRPMGTIVEALRTLGAEIDSAEVNGQAALPFTVHGTGRLAGGELEIDASASSQFVSALLLAAPLMERGLDLRHVGGRLPSTPHIDMTVDVLREAGISSGVHDDEDGHRWVVTPSVPKLTEVDVEADLSNAGPFLAAAMVTGGSVSIERWPATTTQAGDWLREAFASMGGTVDFEPTGRTGTLTLRGPETIRPIDVDMHDVGELVPTVAAVCAFASGPSRLRDIGQLRGHETDRLAALVAELEKIGVRARIDGDDLVIEPTGEYHPAQLSSYDDHRMATFGAILGLCIDGVVVENIETTSKTLPGFVTLWEDMVGETHE